MPPILIDIETTASVKIGSGPLSALRWRWVRKLDRAGNIQFDTPATDSRVSILSLRRYARCYSQIATTRTELGLGIIDSIGLDTNQRDLTVGGDDLLRELALRPVGDLPLVGAGETAITIAAALDAIIALAPAWTLDRTTYASATVGVFYTFSGESVLAALAKVAALTGTHFRLGVGREIVWLFDAQPSSGIRAVVGADAIAAEANQDICLITSLTYVQDSSEVISRIYPHGSGTGAARLSLANTTRTAPSGYVLNAAQNYIERTAAETDYGFAARHQSFNDIAPSVPDTDADYAAAVVSASNTLYDLAFEYLRTHSYPQETYKIGVTKLDRVVRPGETIRVIYRDWTTQVHEVTGEVAGYKWVDINADLIVLESTTEINNAGIHTPSLMVSTVDRWPASDLELLIALAKQVSQAQAHNQPVTTAQVSGAQVVVTPGKTLTVSNSLTLSGTDSEALTLTGSLAVGADTTISGGGTVALGGFTATVPATGTVALLGVANVFTQNQSINKSAAANFTVKSTAAGAQVWIDGPAATNRDILFLTGGVSRFNLRVLNTAESGSDAGSNLVLNAHSDAGTSLGAVFTVTRATLAIAFGGDITVANAKNIILATGTGTKIGTGTTQKLGFWNATPVVQQALSAYTTDAESVAYTGIDNAQAGTVYAAVADLNQLRAAYETLRAAYDDLRTKLQTTGIVG